MRGPPALAPGPKDAAYPPQAGVGRVVGLLQGIRDPGVAVLARDLRDVDRRLDRLDLAEEDRLLPVLKLLPFFFGWAMGTKYPLLRRSDTTSFVMPWSSNLKWRVGSR